MQVLDSLWQALGMQEMADDRAIFNKLMSGQYRLHSKSLEKVSNPNHCYVTTCLQLAASVVAHAWNCPLAACVTTGSSHTTLQPLRRSTSTACRLALTLQPSHHLPPCCSA